MTSESSDPREQGQSAPPPPALPNSIEGLSQEQGQQVLGELMAGRKIQAIKLYREFTQADLKTAKDAVEAVEAQLPGGPGARRKAGCGPAVLLLASGLAAAVYAVSHV